MPGKDEPKPDPNLDEPDHEPTDAELDERVSLYPLDPEQLLRRLLATPPGKDA